MKLAGSHLDPKTRALISVITKVDAQTEAGFAQYLKRALDAGATADEVVDALLMAFPILGLTKVLWAMDRVLAMDLPGFRPETGPAGAGWHELGSMDTLADGATRRLHCDGREVFVHRSGESVWVYDARCPHQQTLIPESGVEGMTLTCPRHGWTFDLEGGNCKIGGRPLWVYPVRVDQGRILAQW
jgi:nitrite reductase/ring-hydroxylating ferredoxin subunit